MQNDPNKQPGLSWSAPQSAQAQKKEASTPAPASSPVPNMHAISEKLMIGSQAPVYAGLLVGGIIVGVLLSTGWSAINGRGTVADIASSTTETAAAADAVANNEAAGGAPFAVADQKAGHNVAVTKLGLSKPAWVVVYANRDGKPGNALGARLFFAGDKQGSVALLRDTAAGQTYFVGLRTDSGDKVFSLTKDKPVAGTDGKPLLVTFKAL